MTCSLKQSRESTSRFCTKVCSVINNNLRLNFSAIDKKLLTNSSKAERAPQDLHKSLLCNRQQLATAFQCY